MGKIDGDSYKHQLVQRNGEKMLIMFLSVDVPQSKSRSIKKSLVTLNDYFVELCCYSSYNKSTPLQSIIEKRLRKFGKEKFRT